MNKSEFVRETSIRLMAASVINSAISKLSYWDSKKAARVCVEDAESLWIELDKKGYID